MQKRGPMRLTCPNCGARYEVDDALIPSEGRDVQCSTCSTTWFQPARVVAAAPETSDAPQEAEAAEEVVPQRVPRREVDPAVRDLLRQEADREERLRREEAAAVVETQEEMPLDPVQSTTQSLRRELSENAEDIYGDEDDDGLANAGFEGSARPRRELFPDIEEINSTLSSTNARAGEDISAADFQAEEMFPSRRRGGRLGFGLVVLIAAAAVVTYIFAADLSELVPALAPSLSVFVEQVDNLRIWLDDTVQTLVASATS